MTVTIPGGTAAGTYQLTITAASGTLSRSANATLVVMDFTVTATPSTQNATAGGSATYTVNVTAQNGFTGAVAFSASGLPAGVTAAFSPATVNSSGSSTMTLAIGAGTAAGSYPLTITAASGGASRTASVTLVVSAAVTGGT